MRTRYDLIENVTRSYSPRETQYRGYNPATGTCKILTNQSAGTYSWTEKLNQRTMSDTVVPHFKARQAKGELFFNPMSSSQDILSRNSGTVSWEICKIDSYGCKTNGAAGTWVIPVSSDPLTCGVGYEPTEYDVSSEKNRLLIEAYSKAYVNDMMLLATLGEFEETVVSVAQTIRAAADILKAFTARKFLLYLASRRMKDLAKIWMHYRYALRPLYFDIIGAFKAFKSLKKVNTIKRQTFRSFGDANNSRTTLTYSVDSWRNYITTYDVSNYISIRTGLLADILINWDTILGLDRLAASAWELVPMSFIIDWFVNIGQLISAFEPTAQRRVLGNFVTVSSATHYRVYITATMREGWHGYYNSDRELVRDHYSKVRFVNSDCEVDVSKNVKLTLAKTLDLGIILKQLLEIKKLC